ncbi:MAG: two-partner secretion domain-containing protein, partial [Planctomycetota bacterium]
MIKFAQGFFGILVILFLCGALQAGVKDGRVVQGQAAFQRNGNLTTIRASDRSIIEYSHFSIASFETVRFIQPHSLAKVLNRVLGPDPSRINGTLRSNGIVYLVNPAGIYFGDGALVDVGGLYAAAGSISNADFLNDLNHFTSLQGEVVNQGILQANLVHLLGRHVSNQGAIVAPEGLVAMTAGEEVILGERAGHVMVKLKSPNRANDTLLDGAPGVQNAGRIEAEAGRVLLSAGDLYSLALQQTGEIRANEIRMEGKGRGIVEAGGLLDASGRKGGRISVTGEKVAVTGTLDASGRLSGGSVHVGGEFQGKGTLRNATRTLIMPDALLRADATQQGDSGEVIVWSDESTRFYGEISAKGGTLSGDGGFVEVSGKQSLSFEGDVDLGAENGNAGTLLLDPWDIEISTNPDTNTTGFTPPGDLVEAFGDDPGVNSVFDVTPVTGSFAGVGNGATIELQASDDVNVLNDFDIATSTGNSDVSLVLRAGDDINVQADITASGTGT